MKRITMAALPALALVAPMLAASPATSATAPEILQLATNVVAIHFHPHGTFYICGDGSPTSAVGSAK